MRARCAAGLFAFALALFAGVARADDKKADPPAKEKAKENKDREVHVVGIYEGYTKSNGMIHGDRAQVSVNRPGKQVILVLVAAKPMTWEVGVNKDTKLEKVILGGNRSAVKGLPEKVEVIEGGREGKGPAFPHAAYKIDSPTFEPMVEALTKLTGQKPTSFTGMYRAEAENVIAVENVHNLAKVGDDPLEVVPAEKLPKLSFQAHRFLPTGERFDVSRSFGEFTLAGPKADTFKALPSGVAKMTYDPVGKKYYGIADHGLAVVDPEKKDKKKYEKLDPGLDVPEISWPSDVMFDTKRNRVLLITSGGPGYLYAYTPKTGKWEALAERPPAVLTYHPKNDMLYGFKGNDDRILQHINSKGEVVSTVALDGPFLRGMLGIGPGVTGVQLVPADDKLVMLIDPVGLRGSETAVPKWSYMYLIDPKTGKAQLVWKEKVGK